MGRGSPQYRRCPSSSQSASAACRATRRRAATATPRRACGSPATSRRGRRCPQSVRRSSGRSATLHRYPDPACTALRRRLSERYGVPAGADRDRQRLVRHPARRGRGAAGAGRRARPRVAVVLDLPAPLRRLGRARGQVALDERERHDLPAMLREITVATRLVVVCNPNNPTSTALPLAEIAEFLAEVPPHVCVILDEAYCEFNLLDDPDASVELLAAHPNLVLLRTFSKVYGLCGLRVGFALCGSLRAAAGARPGAPAVLLQRGRAGRRHRGARTTRMPSPNASRARSPSGSRWTSGCVRWGSTPAESQANFCWLGSAKRETKRRSCAACCERGVLVRGGGALGREGALRVTYGTPGGERDLSGCACRGALKVLQTTRDDHVRTAALTSCRTLRLPTGRPPTPTPGDLARRFGLRPSVSGLGPPGSPDRAPPHRACEPAHDAPRAFQTAGSRSTDYPVKRWRSRPKAGEPSPSS